MAAVLEMRYPKPGHILRSSGDMPYRLMIGTGGIGSGSFFALEGNETLGRNESRPGKLLDVRDYCKLHIIAHYVAVLLGAGRDGKFDVLPVGRVGKDDLGKVLTDEMKQVGMDTRFIATSPDRPTMFSCCFQYPDASGGNITDNNSASAALTEADIDKIEPVMAENAGRFIALAAPEVPLKARARLLELATKYNGLRAGSFAPAEIAEATELGMFGMLDLLSINEDEASAIAGIDFDPANPQPMLDACAAALTANQGDIEIIISAGSRGAYGYSKGLWQYCPTPEVPVKSSAGAGDALIGSAICAKAAGLPLIKPDSRRVKFSDRPIACALELAILFASLTVGSPHTIAPSVTGESILSAVEDLALKMDDSVSKLFRPCSSCPCKGRLKGLDSYK